MKKAIQLLLMVFILFLSSCEEIEQIQPPIACMDLSSYSFLVGETIKVSDCSENTKVSYFMVNDKVINSRRKDYNYTFEEAGEYDIKLVSYNRSLRDALTIKVTVQSESIEDVYVRTSDVENITGNSAVCGGEVNTNELVVSRGIVYGYNENVSLENRIETLFSDSGEGQFVVQMNDLLPNTLYYVKAFAQVGTEYFYGQLQIFSTQVDGVTILLNEPTDVTFNAANISGEVSEMPSNDVFDKGIIYSVNPDPTIGGVDVDGMSYGEGLGEFHFELTGLNPQTTYYVKAYAFNSNSEYFYSLEQSFITLEEDDQFKWVNVDYTNESPQIDGVVDALWENVDARFLNVPLLGIEEVSFNNPASFKALWDDDYIYILVDVPDDDFYPALESGQYSWASDKPELYLDVNENKIDGYGPSYEDGILDDGHYQFAPGYMEEEDRVTWEYDIYSDESGYRVEYAIPFDVLKDKDGLSLNPYERKTIGFDLTIIDLDEEGKGNTIEQRQRINWSNYDMVYESWVSMDKSGDFNFVGGSNPPSKAVVFEEDFESSTGVGNVNLEGWLNEAEKGVKLWESFNYEGNLVAYMSSYGSEEENMARLITPPISLEDTENEEFTFDVKIGYFKHSGLQVILSNDYDGTNLESASWNDITAYFTIPELPVDDYSEFQSAGVFDLSSYSGTVSIGFVYTGSALTDETTTYQIDNILVREK